MRRIDNGTQETFLHSAVRKDPASLTGVSCRRQPATPDQWRAVLSTNLDSVFNVTRHAIDAMVERGWGASSTSLP
jgi:NAD(P)-dependent dehydrogenase (short-subunit alcohol dehydrogenase family)